MSNSLFPVPTVPKKFNTVLNPEDSLEFTKDTYDSYFSTTVGQAHELLEQRSGAQWEAEGQDNALQLFHAAAKRVPAYTRFLTEHGVDPKRIQTFEDFREQVPVMDKDNYLRRNDIRDLCWDGDLERADILSVSSGSSGKPYLWPRDASLEFEVTYFFELFMESFFNISKRRTLVVDCFAMGMYVGGPFFLNATLRIAQKGYPVTVVTPGNVMADILRVVQELLPKYEQVILSGYPPFLKDVIENGEEEGIDWKSVNTVLLPAGEGFSEFWRDAVLDTLGQKGNVSNLLGYYGTADAAVLGVETPWSVAARRAIASDGEFVTEVFGQSRLPSFMQYFPTQRYFELIEDELHFTTANGCIPLIRYNIHDHGGLLTFDQVEDLAKKKGVDIRAALPEKAWQLPFVYVFGRSDHTVILYGANVYPENVKEALETTTIAEKCTGRFVMEVEEDHFNNSYLSIHIECQKGVRPMAKLKKQLIRTIKIVLEEVNAEYANMAKAIGDRSIPQVFLHSYGDDNYFRRDAKQKWKQ